MKLTVLSLTALMLFAAVVSSLRPHAPAGARQQRPLELNGKKDDFIDAEVVGENGGKDRLRVFGGMENKKPDERKTRNPIVQGLLKVFGQDEKSIKKREQEKQVDTMIDKVFEGSGLLGMGMSGIIKGVAKMAAAAMTESMGETEEVMNAVRQSLRSSSVAKSYFGEDINISAPMSTMSSSMSINGNVQKTVTLILPVFGRLSNGIVKVSASCRQGEAVKINEMVLQTQDGREVPISTSSSGRGGGGSGSVIDV